MANVLKVEVRSSIGFSIQTKDGDWVKSGVDLNVHLDGYPTEDELGSMLKGLTLQAYGGSTDQIQLLVGKINGEVPHA